MKLPRLTLKENGKLTREEYKIVNYFSKFF